MHLVCTGSEAVDLAVQMARVYTGHNQVVGLYKGEWNGTGPRTVVVIANRV